MKPATDIQVFIKLRKKWNAHDTFVLGSALRSIEIWRCDTGGELTGAEQNAFDKHHNIKNSLLWTVCKSLPVTLVEWLAQKTFSGLDEVLAVAVSPDTKVIAIRMLLDSW